METITRKRSSRPRTPTLFEAAGSARRDDFRARVRRFAAEVAKRHRRGSGDLSTMLAALREWHRAWALCDPNATPELAEEDLAVAVAAYAARGRTKHPAAA